MGRHTVKTPADLSRELRELPDETLLIRWQVLGDRAKSMLHNALRIPRPNKARDLKLRQYLRLVQTSTAFRAEITRRMNT